MNLVNRKSGTFFAHPSRQWLASGLWRAAWALIAVIPPAESGIVVDHTISAGGKLTGPNYQITANLGQLLGTNLFFSFSQFSLVQGESATFSGPSSVTRIISRVTGGDASSIDGLIASTILGADLYFINPAGMTFGPHASVDVPGSFFVSSAHYLTLADGGRFNAGNPSASSLTSAPPQAFGFLGGQGAIVFQGTPINAQTATSISVVGGDVTLDAAQFSVTGGSINIVSTNAAGTVILGTTGITATAPLNGAVTIVDGAVVSSASDSQGFLAPGPISINGGSLLLDASTISTVNTSSLAAGPVAFGLGGTLTVDHYGLVQSLSQGSGKGGDETIVAGQVILQNGATLDTEAQASGGGGDINIQSGDVQVLSEAFINTATDPYGDQSSGTFGDAGNITIKATGTISVSGDSQNSTEIESITFTNGQAGTIEVDAPQVSLANGGISASTVGASGNSGNIVVNAQDVALMNGGSIQAGVFDNGDPNSVGDAAAGRITINASHSLILTGLKDNESQISVLNQGSGNGAGGAITLNTPLLSIDSNSFVDSDIFGSTPNPGFIDINANVINLQGVISGSTHGSANGQSVTIVAHDTLTMDGNAAEIFTDAEGAEETGNAGRLSIEVTQLTIGTGALINSETQGSGHGGNVSIQGARFDLSGTVSAQSSGSGPAGDLVLDFTNAIELHPGALLSTQSTGGADGGNIRLSAGTLLYLDDAQITTSAGTAESGSGNGGNISIDPQSVVLNGSEIFANAFGGRGGNISIVTSHLVPSADSHIQASSQFGLDGTISVSSPMVNIGQELGRLSTDFQDPSRLFRQGCASRKGDTISRFTAVGGGGLPESSRSPLFSHPNGLRSAPSIASAQKSERTVEPDELRLAAQVASDCLAFQ